MTGVRAAVYTPGGVFLSLEEEEEEEVTFKRRVRLGFV
jgi:hypothetical protein